METELADCKYRRHEALSVYLPGHCIVSKKEPEAEDGLSEDIEDGVCDDLSVNINIAGSISNTPDTTAC